jgi:predicted transcriptional regulator
MPRPAPLPDLTRAEIEVLKPLWSGGPSSAREVHDAVATDWAYTTTRTFLERLVAKGHVTKRRVHGMHVYAARVPRVAALAAAVRAFARSVLEIEPVHVVPLFLKGEALSEDEIEELESLLRKNGGGP